MFEQALLVALFLGYGRAQQFASRAEKPPLVPELMKVLAGICASVNATLSRKAISDAQAFYGILTSRFQDKELWYEKNSWLISYLEPIGDYLNILPGQPLIEFVTAAWLKKSTSDSDTDL
jgi:hypothetical protein